jgi:hypothetical protein
MKRTGWIAVTLLSCLGIFASGCDSAVSSDELNGNAFTNAESKLERVRSVSESADPTSAPDGELSRAYWAVGSGLFTLHPTRVSAARLDDDAFDDLVVRYRYGGAHCTGCEASMVTLSVSPGAADSSQATTTRLHDRPLDVADLDADGQDELVSLDRQANEIAVYDHETGEERARFGPMPCLTTATGSGETPAYQLVDVNHDSRADLVCVGRRQDWKADQEPVITIYLARADELGFAEATEHRWTGELRGLGDFDGDGNLDYLTRESSSEVATTEAEALEAVALKLAVAYGDGTGAFSEPMRVYENPQLQAGRLLEVADFDGDGASDLIWVDDLESCVAVPDDGAPCAANPLGAEPAILFGRATRGEPFVRETLALNLMTARGIANVVSHAADLDGDEAAELILISFDRQFGYQMGSFLRVMQVVGGQPVLVSNTRLNTAAAPVGRQNLPEIIDYQVVDGHFAEGSGAQLLVLDPNTGDSALYRWTTVE